MSETILKRYMREVLNDDYVVGSRCAEHILGQLSEAERAEVVETYNALRVEEGLEWLSPLELTSPPSDAEPK